MKEKTIFGAEIFCEREYEKYRGKNIAILLNQSSIVFDRETTLECLLKKGLKIKKVFFPQHGYYQDKQDNMKESENMKINGIEYISLYGKKFYPTDEDLDGIDIFLYDLQDVGTRIYTFVSTLFLLLKALDGTVIKLIVLDRPNPLGRKVEGNLVEEEFKSFVGIYSLPMLYGLTPAELAIFFIKRGEFQIDYEVIKMENWKGFFYEKTNRFWYPPSPNMPHYLASYVYPGSVLLEGTNISEGRGTTRPFEILGAPFIDGRLLSRELNSLNLQSVHFIPYYFTPTFNKWKGELCGGIFIRVFDMRAFEPYKTGILILKKIREIYGDKLKWNPPPYEYEHEKLPIDIITGGSKVREFIDEGEGIKDLDKLLNNDKFENNVKTFDFYDSFDYKTY